MDSQNSLKCLNGHHELNVTVEQLAFFNGKLSVQLALAFPKAQFCKWCQKAIW